MKTEIRYIDYKIYDNDGFHIHAKISPKGITMCNKVAKSYPHEFQFIQSNPELVDKFSKAMKIMVKLSKEQNEAPKQTKK